MLKFSPGSKRLGAAHVFDVRDCGPRNQFWANGKIVENCNFRNFPTSTPDFPPAGELRNSIMAPPGHVIFAPDSAQIEARVVAWISEHSELLDRFRNKEDVYKWMASSIYDKSIEEAIESGIVTKSFDRLLHEDMKIAYEAFVLIALVIKSGEMDCIFSAIKDNRDDRVKLALLHVIQVVRDPVSFDELSKLRSTSFSPEVTAKLKDAIEAFEAVMA